MPRASGAVTLGVIMAGRFFELTERDYSAVFDLRRGNIEVTLMHAPLWIAKPVYVFRRLDKAAELVAAHLNLSVEEVSKRLIQHIEIRRFI